MLELDCGRSFNFNSKRATQPAALVFNAFLTCRPAQSLRLTVIGQFGADNGFPIGQNLSVSKTMGAKHTLGELSHMFANCRCHGYAVACTCFARNISQCASFVSNKTVNNLLDSSQLSHRLLTWYDKHHRTLPWRASPGAERRPGPYHVWLSEIMLQQTTVAAVKEYFLKFTANWPDVHALADAELDDVLRAWAGLGYYARARNLHKCARMISEEHYGQFPRSVPDLIKLPGIGPYTAAAISAIAFDEPVAAVDGNVERVISRYYAIETPLPILKSEVQDKTELLVPQQRAGDFAQALMDLGATICAPRKANCLICPWMDTCRGRETGIAETLPRKAPKKIKPTRRGTCFWIERENGDVLLRRRPEKGLLGGMMEVPSTDWTEQGPSNPAAEAPFQNNWKKLGGVVTHTFTHFHLELVIWKAHAPSGEAPDLDGSYSWVELDYLGAEALPSVMRKVCTAVLDRKV